MSVPAKAALEKARGQVAALFRAVADEIVFTSSGSEANNLALKGTFFSQKDRGKRIITTAVKHPAIGEPSRFLEWRGATVTYPPVDRIGRVNADAALRAITPRAILIRA